MIPAILALVLPLAAGWCIARAALPRLRPRWASLAIESGAGGGIGVGAASVVYFLLLLAGAASMATVLIADVLLAAGAAALLRFRALNPAEPARTQFRWNWLLALALAAGFALAGSGLIQAAAAAPNGEWDAWAIWNLRARFLASSEWRHAISPLLEHTHPDYPLLLSGFVAMVWKAAGDTPQWVPASLGFVFLVLVVSLLVGALAVLRATSSALLAGFLLLCATSFLFLAAMQYADLPLSLYYASALSLFMLSRAFPERGRAMLLLAGVAASLAAWTRNEGLLFAVAFLVCSLVAEARAEGWKKALPLALGAAPVLLLVACFKFLLAPAADPLVTQGAASALAKLAEPSRYAEIGKALAVQAYNFGSPNPFLMFALLAFALRFRLPEQIRTAWRASTLALALVFLGYCGAYLVTPSSLSWHLQSSLTRLYGQLWPSFVLVAAAVLRPLEETAPAPPPAKLKRRS